MGQSVTPPMDSIYEPSTTDNFGILSYPAWEQCWSANQPMLPGPSEAPGGNTKNEYDIEVFKYGYTLASPNLTGSIFSQEYRTPPRTSGLICPERSPSSSDGQPCSLSTQPNKQKRKRNATERAPAKRSGYASSKKAKAKTAAGEVRNTRKGGSTNKAAETNLSLLQFKNDEYTKVEERNRTASNKFRRRKQEDEKKLESAEKTIEQINRDLSTCVTNLTLQVYNLKMKLLQHTDCDCALIQEYIANEAHRYIQDLGDRNQCQQP